MKQHQSEKNRTPYPWNYITAKSGGEVTIADKGVQHFSVGANGL